MRYNLHTTAFIHLKCAVQWFFFFFFNFYLFIYGCVGFSFLYEGFLQLRQEGATLHRGARATHYRGHSLRSTGSRRAGSAIVAHGPSCSAACGIFPDQGSNPCPLHWQADSQPLRHQGSPQWSFIYSELYNHHHNQFQGSEETLYPLAITSFFPLSPPGLLNHQSIICLYRISYSGYFI